MTSDETSMGITALYVHAMFYDTFEDQVFDALLPIQGLEIKYFNNVHNNINDVAAIKYKGKIENTAEGSILLGCL